MGKPLVRLVYRSRSLLSRENGRELDDIFRSSVRNNLRNRVTGCLANPEGYFVQVLEGEASAVDSLVKRLASDNRHTDIVVLARWSTPARLFPRWAMARPEVHLLTHQSARLLSDTGTGAQITALLLSLVENDASIRRTA